MRRVACVCVYPLLLAWTQEIARSHGFYFSAVMVWMCSCMEEREPENDRQTARPGNWSVGFSSEASTGIDRIRLIRMGHM